MSAVMNCWSSGTKLTSALEGMVQTKRYYTQWICATVKDGCSRARWVPWEVNHDGMLDYRRYRRRRRALLLFWSGRDIGGES